MDLVRVFVRIARVARLASVVAALVAVAACALRASLQAPLPTRDSPVAFGGSAVVPASDGSGLLTGFGTWVYTCSINASTCPVYTLSGTKPTYKSTYAISGNPSSGFATAAGKWYIALRAAQKIAEYKSTSGGPKATGTSLTDSGESPADVAVNTTHNFAVVSNIFADTNNVNHLSVYVRTATTPTRVLNFTAPGGGGGFGVGVGTDSAGNCYWAVDDNKLFVFYIVEYTACKGAGKTIFTSGKFDSAGGVAVDGSNNLFFVDNSNQMIYRCKGASSCAVIASGFANITFIRFDNGWQHLWTTDSSAGKLYALDPTTGKKLSTTSEPTAANSLAIAPGPAY